MRFDTYVNKLQSLLTNNPEYASCNVIYSTNDNTTHCKVYSTGEVGHYYIDDQEFVPEALIDELIDDPTSLPINAVCIN